MGRRKHKKRREKRRERNETAFEQMLKDAASTPESQPPRDRFAGKARSGDALTVKFVFEDLGLSLVEANPLGSAQEQLLGQELRKLRPKATPDPS